MLLRDGEVDVARQLFGSAESLADIKVAFNDYAFVDSYEVLNPFVDKKNSICYNKKNVYNFELEKTLDEKVLMTKLKTALDKKQKRRERALIDSRQRRYL